MLLRLKNLLNKLSYSFKRFPIALLYSISASIVLILINNNTYRDYDMYMKLAKTLSLGIPLSLTIYIYFEGKSPKKKYHPSLFHGFILVLLSLYYLISLKSIDMVDHVRFTSYSISLYLLFSLVPFFYRRRDYELYVVRLFSSFIVTYLYSIILYIGLAAILSTINLLFNVHVSASLYLDILITVAGIFAPTFFLSKLPEKNVKIYDQAYPKVLEVLLQYIILPLISLYTIILYVYFVKILLIMELPQGIIGNLVLWYSIVATIILFFIYPLKNDNRWVNAFVKIFPRVIIPLLFIMFVAIGIRINSYGITEGRYFVLLVSLWVTGTMLYYSLGKKLNNIIVTVSLVLIGFLSVTGPWNAFEISKYSQNKRLEAILLRNNMLTANLTVKKPEIELEEEDKRQINDIIMYFNQEHKLAFLKHLPEDFKIEAGEEVLGFKLEEYGLGLYGDREYFSHHIDGGEVLLDIINYDAFMEISDYGEEEYRQILESYLFIYDSEQNLIVKEKGEIKYKVNLGNIAIDIHKNNKEKYNLTRNDMEFVDENESIEIYGILKDFSGYKIRNNDKTYIERLGGYIFIRIK